MPLSNHLGARSKVKVSADSNSRKGRKKEQNSNSCWDSKKLWAAPAERNNSSRNSSMDTWNNVTTTSWNDARNKKDSWEDSMIRKRENPTVWSTSNIEQDFPTLGGSQQQPQRNVWTERLRKSEEVKILQPASKAEEEKMMKIALEMSKYDVKSDEAKRKRLEEEYRLQEEMLSKNPDHFKDFVPEDLCSEVYASSKQKDFTHDNNSSNNNNWDTWNDYSNFGVKNNTSSKNTSKNKSGWNDSSHETSKSALQNNSNQKDYESIWGIDANNPNSDNLNGFSVPGNKKNFSNKSATSNYNSVHNFNDPSLTTTQQPKTETATRNKEYDSIWDSDIDYKNSDACNHSDSGGKKNSTSTGASTYKNDNHWDNSTDKSQDGWKDNSDSGDKKNSTFKSVSSCKKDYHRDDSTHKSHKQSAKKYEKCDDVLSSDVDYYNSGNLNDNTAARDKRNYSNFEAASSCEEKLVSKGSKVSANNPDSNSAQINKSFTKVVNKKTSLNKADSSKGATDDIKKVIDLFGGWGSASDYSRKPTVTAKSVGNAIDNPDHKNAFIQNVTSEHSVNPSTTVASKSTSKFAVQNNSIKSKNLQNSVKELEEKTAEIKLSDDTKSAVESPNTHINNEINPLPKESSEVKNNYLVTDDLLMATPTPKTSDFIKSDVFTSNINDSNVLEHLRPIPEHLTELNYVINEGLPTDSSSVSYISSPKPSESADISKPIESLKTTDCVDFSASTTHSSDLNLFSIEETSQTNQSSDIELDSTANNFPSGLPPTDLPFESPINPILPINPMIGGFMMPGMNSNLMAGMNPIMMPGMNPLLMQQMLFLSNPFLASQFRAMEMYYQSLGMATVPQGMVPPQMCSTPGFTASAFPNVTNNNYDNNTINAPVPSYNFNAEVSVAPLESDSDSQIINPPMYPSNSKLSIPLNDYVDSGSHILRYDPEDADSLLQQFLEPCENDTNFIPPPVMPNSRNENAVNKQIPSFVSETYSPAVKSNASSFIYPPESGDNIGNKNTNSTDFANSEASWNGTASAKESNAAAPESTGWGDFDSDGKQANWNEEIDGWGNENYTLKAMGNPSRYDSKKRSVNRQPSSQPTFSRYKN